MEASCQRTAGEETGEGTWLGDVTMAVEEVMAAQAGVRGRQTRRRRMDVRASTGDGLCAGTEKLVWETISLQGKARESLPWLGRPSVTLPIPQPSLPSPASLALLFCRQH